MYVATAQGVALLFNEYQYGQWSHKDGAKGVYVGQKFAVNNIVRFMAVNTRSKNRNITRIFVFLTLGRSLNLSTPLAFFVYCSSADL